MVSSGVRRFTDKDGSEVRLTDELLRFAETLANQDAVRPSGSSPTVYLYFRLYPDLRGRNHYICLVVKKETDYSFILTGYLARRIRGE